MSKTKRLRREAADWSALVEACERSGQSRAAFAEREGIHPGTFGFWASRLATKRLKSLIPTAGVALAPDAHGVAALGAVELPDVLGRGAHVEPVQQLHLDRHVLTIGARKLVRLTSVSSTSVLGTFLPAPMVKPPYAAICARDVDCGTDPAHQAR